MIELIYILTLVIYIMYYISLRSKEDKSKLARNVIKVTVAMMIIQTLGLFGLENKSTIGIYNSVILNLIYCLSYNFFGIFSVILIGLVDAEDK